MNEATDVREIWTSLVLPGIVDVHPHCMRSVTGLPGVDERWLRAVLYHNAARVFSL